MDTKKKAILGILKEALKRETDAFNYYVKASRRTSYPETESLFVQLAEEERKHRVFLIQELNRVEKLMTRAGKENFVTADRVSYSLPEKITFKRLQTPSLVELAGVSLPTEFLGGDYLGTIVLEPEKRSSPLAIFLYDVMGHGLEATQLKSLVKKLFGELHERWAKKKSSVELDRPLNVMRYINQKVMYDSQKCTRFISAFYGVIDPLNKKLTYTSAGHEPPILIKSGGKYHHLEETELLLGVDRDVKYSEVEVPIDTGDVLVLFSDGITEVMNQHEEMFERDRLRRAVEEICEGSASEIVHHILGRLREFLKGNPVTDEFTLAVMKITGL